MRVTCSGNLAMDIMVYAIKVTIDKFSVREQ